MVSQAAVLRNLVQILVGKNAKNITLGYKDYNYDSAMNK